MSSFYGDETDSIRDARRVIAAFLGKDAAPEDLEVIDFHLHRVYGCGAMAERVCAHCGEPAACFGAYEEHFGFSCDTCCGHGCEDGYCESLNLDSSEGDKG